jgi:acyl-CoA thioesterase
MDIENSSEDKKWILEFFQRDHFASKNGIVVVDISPGKAIARMEITKNHLNGVGTVHGGAIFSLADFAFALASNSYGQVSVAINVNISYFKPSSSGVLTATAKEVSKGGRIASYSIEITDQESDLVALFQGMAYRKKEKLSDLI